MVRIYEMFIHIWIPLIFVNLMITLFLSKSKFFVPCADVYERDIRQGQAQEFGILVYGLGTSSMD